MILSAKNRHLDEMLKYHYPKLPKTQKKYIKKLALKRGESNEFHLTTQTRWNHANVEELYHAWKASQKSLKIHMLNFWEWIGKLFKRKHK
jgi:hypothetical protein